MNVLQLLLRPKSAAERYARKKIKSKKKGVGVSAIVGFFINIRQDRTAPPDDRLSSRAALTIVFIGAVPLGIDIASIR